MEVCGEIAFGWVVGDTTALQNLDSGESCVYLGELRKDQCG